LLGGEPLGRRRALVARHQLVEDAPVQEGVGAGVGVSQALEGVAEGQRLGQRAPDQALLPAGRQRRPIHVALEVEVAKVEPRHGRKAPVAHHLAQPHGRDFTGERAITSRNSGRGWLYPGPALAKEVQVTKAPGFGRRAFVGGAGAAAMTALSYRRVLGANDRIRLGVIGTGMRAQSLMKRLKELPGNEQIALCDVYEPRLLEGVAIVGPQAQQHRDHREVLDRKDVDGVVVGAPQHWHKQMLFDALKADKDIYLEKCVSHSIEEGPEMVRAVEAAPKRVVQTGTQQRSWAHWIQGPSSCARGSWARSTTSTPTGTRTSPTASTPSGSRRSWTGRSSPARPSRCP
jgi:hypothetical protein